MPPQAHVFDVCLSKTASSSAPLKAAGHLLQRRTNSRLTLTVSVLLAKCICILNALNALNG
ncbi:MAG: hypothetical protein RLZZ367_1494 [Bacteroidota bacterium]|jgi:hypothetical protein